MKLHQWIILVLGFLIVGSLFLWPGFQTEDTVIDELTGTWQAGGTTVENFDWSMTYTFKNGKYDLETGTNYAETGVYEITKRFLDGSFNVKKTYDGGKKVYEMTVITTKNPDVIFIEGAQLNRIDNKNPAK